MPARPEPPETDAPARRPGPPVPLALIVVGVIAAALGWLYLAAPAGEPNSLTDLQESVTRGEVAKVTLVGKARIVAELREKDGPAAKRLRVTGSEFWVNLPEADSQYPLLEDLNRLDREFRKRETERLRLATPALNADQAEAMLPPRLQVSRRDDPAAWLTPILLSALVMLLMFMLFFAVFVPRMRGDPVTGQPPGAFIRSPARLAEKGESNTTFADVAGIDAAKAELMEIVDFLKSPEKYERLGAQIPKGVLLVGPPGTGKTLMARAVAGEAGVPFYNVNGSEFIQLFVGVGASRVRDLFRGAKESAPCLIFIDEIDAVGRMRGAGVGGGSDEREQTLNQILSEMDGFTPSETVVVIAATNRPDVLDSALLRPGRFDRHVHVDRPTWKGRLAILQVHVRNKPLAEDVDLEAIAKRSFGMTGAELRNLANEAALVAARRERNKLTAADFDEAADRVMLGSRREDLLTEEDKRRVAYHEAGHALVAWLTPRAGKPARVTIVPRGRALGVNILPPDENATNDGADFFRARLAMTLGGRAADRLISGQAYAGHENDLKQATHIARAMVARWGMSDRLGPIALRVGEEHVFLGKEIQESRDFSEGTAQVVDQEVQRLVREADDHAYQLIASHRPQLEAIVAALLDKEELTRDDLEAILSPTLGPSLNGAVPREEGKGRPVEEDAGQR